ncbi:MAG: transposase, partial [Gemmatimonas sp.]
MTDGGFRPDGTFVSWPAHDTARLTEAFRRAVLRLFVRLEHFDEDQAAGMLTWPHSGFHVHTAVWVPSEGQTAGTETADPLEFLARVLVHIPDQGHVTTRFYGWYPHPPPDPRFPCGARRAT